MRNIFDQYRSPENRISHALGASLGEDPRLLRHFVRWLTGNRAPVERLQVYVQQMPGQPEPFEEGEAERRGIPDIWICGEDTWCIVIEAKVAAGFNADQLRRHERIAERIGFEAIVPIAITAKTLAEPPRQTVCRTWPEVYEWLRHKSAMSEWAGRCVEYMEVAERQMIQDGYLKGGAVTQFCGFMFDAKHPYTYGEGKRLLALAMEKLRARRDLKKFGIDAVREGRPAITGSSGNSVWDFIPLKAARHSDAFTRYPHLTLAVRREELEVIVVVPNGIDPKMRSRLLGTGVESFKSLLGDLAKNLTQSTRYLRDAQPLASLKQRHFVARRFSIQDAIVEFDLRVVNGSRSGGVKRQLEWINSMYAVMENQKSNLQFAVGAQIPYDDKRVQNAKILDDIAAVWIACSPLVDRLIN